MHREYQRWRSPRLKRDMELLRFGHAGPALIHFPTSGGRFFEAEDRGLVAALGPLLNAGRLQMIAVDGYNKQSWNNRRVQPANRVKRHEQYERYVREEVMPYARHVSGEERVLVSGVSMGGYHAFNLSLRHPQLVRACLTLGGAMQIRRFLPRQTDAYFHNPPEYLPNLQDPFYLDRFRAIRWVLAVGERDFLVEENRQAASLLAAKQIPHQLDVWGNGAAHDWPWWNAMAAKHLG